MEKGVSGASPAQHVHRGGAGLFTTEGSPVRRQGGASQVHNGLGRVRDSPVPL